LKPDRQLPASASSAVVRLQADGTASSLNDQVAVEEPLEIRIGNRPFVVTMRTPGNDEELAAGFMTSEGIASSKADFREIDRCPLSSNPENTIRIRFSDKIDGQSVESRRYGAVSSSCGVCGKTSITAIGNSHTQIESDLKVRRQLLFDLPERLRENQVVFDRTGGLHSSGIFNQDGELVCLREDVGRHNALDKAIGYSLLNGVWPLNEHILLVSGRVSFEIIQKALAAKIPLVAAVSAPSSLAIEVAREYGVTLIGFLRPPKMNVYSHPQRILD